MKFVSLCFVLISALFASCAKQAEFEQTQLHTTLHEYANKLLHAKDADGGYITAISLTAQCADHAPVSEALGTNGIKDLTPINENSIFQIGSVTKAFVCVVVLQLAEENKISIDDNTVMMKWFPEYPKWGNITLRQLMNMTSGIPGNGTRLPDDIFKKFTAKEYTGKIDPIHILNLTYQLPLHFEPGTSFEYSNTNYTLLGRFIKKVTHNDPEKEVTDRIIKKLGLRNTHFPVDLEEEVPNIDKKKLVHGYAFYSKNSDPYPFMTYGADTLPYSLSSANTGGAMISTPHDINIFLHALFNKDGLFHRYQKQLTTFVSKKTGAPITAPTEEDRQGFGLGLVGYYWNATHPIIYIFDGTMDGFRSAWLFDPKSQVYLTFAINSHADLLSLEDALRLFEKVESSAQYVESREKHKLINL
jgi:D-alanyl-D-alanine carboxypeptidase